MINHTINKPSRIQYSFYSSFCLYINDKSFETQVCFCLYSLLDLFFHILVGFIVQNLLWNLWVTAKVVTIGNLCDACSFVFQLLFTCRKVCICVLLVTFALIHLQCLNPILLLFYHLAGQFLMNGIFLFPTTAFATIDKFFLPSSLLLPL